MKVFPNKCGSPYRLPSPSAAPPPSRSERIEDPGDGPGAGGGYADRLEVPYDGPGAGGGYADRLEVPHEVPHDGPGAGGGYDDKDGDSDGPGAGGGYGDSLSSFGGVSGVVTATWGVQPPITVSSLSYLPIEGDAVLTDLPSGAEWYLTSTTPPASPSEPKKPEGKQG